MARLIEKRLKEKVAPLDDNEMRMLRENVRQPYLLGAVLKTNDQLVAARKATEAIVTPDPRPLADLTDGEEIFRKIVEPNGNLLPTVAPRPDHPEAIRHIIEEVANSQ